MRNNKPLWSDVGTHRRMRPQKKTEGYADPFLQTTSYIKLPLATCGRGGRGERGQVVRVILATLLILILTTIVSAQDDTDVDVSTIETSVYATTQFDLNFREGPGLNWDVISVIPGDTTVPVIGRVSSTAWIQIIYEGQLGWISTQYTVWSGDIITVPIDGQYFDDYVRRVWLDATTVRETPIYSEWVDPSTQVGTIPEGTDVEVVGRLGYRNDLMFDVLILYNGEYYWVGAWNLNLRAFEYQTVLDNSYRNAYSRLVSQFSSDISDGRSRMNTIENIWVRLQSGQAVSCSFIPELLPQRTVSDADINSYPEFASVGIVFDAAVGHVNTAISMFDDACNRTDSFITQQDVRIALDEVDSARQNFNVAASLLQSLRRRDPLLGDIETD